IIHAARCRQVSEYRVFRVKRERDETIEPTRLVLQFAQPDKMVHTLFQRLDVAVKHRRVRSDSLLMNGPRNIEPAIARNLMPGNQRSGALGKNLRTSAGAAPHPGFVKLVDHPFERLAADL